MVEEACIFEALCQLVINHLVVGTVGSFQEVIPKMRLGYQGGTQGAVDNNYQPEKYHFNILITVMSILMHIG